MPSRRRSARLVVRPAVGTAGVAIIVVCVALAVPAFGFASRSTRTVVVRELGNATVTASCPRGEHVAFGGVIGEFKPPPKTLGHPSVFPTSMHRTAANRWTVSGRSEAFGTGSHLSAVAYCDRGAVPRVASSTIRLAGFGVKTAIATCPAGTIVVGGGYSSGSSRTNVEYVGQLGRATPTEWAVTMVNIEKAATTITALAYCAAGTTPTEHVVTHTLAGRKGATVRVSCPAGTMLVFGGVLASPPLGSTGHLSAVIPFSWTAASTTQWVVTGYNVGNLSGTLTALSYCR